MKVLLHACCGPCTLFPARALREEGHVITACFVNPNIHPYLEYERRVEAMEEVARVLSLPVLWDEVGYGLSLWLERVGTGPAGVRCQACYALRIDRSAEIAHDHGHDAFTTTLLFSRYQDHEAIRRAGEAASARFGVRFLYQDFRKGWEEGNRAARELGIYRQPYCGCVMSEAERYAKRAVRLMKRLAP
ncbi:MAG: epoxyqueuosine reductase QueH [Deltaproteobacteria bacterium]